MDTVTQQPAVPAASPMRSATAAVPVLLFSFVFCLIVDNGFKTMTGPMAQGMGMDPNTVSLEASLAGIIIGIGAVVYAALADAIPIRTLMLIGIGLITVGSLMGFFFSRNWNTVLAGRLIQTCGLAAAETLYVIFVTKHLPAEDQKTYLGFSTAAFSAGLLVGALASGAISTYISWTDMFLIPLILLLAVPFILKNVPVYEATSSSLDIWGLAVVAGFSGSLIMLMQECNWWWLLPAAVGIALFALHVRTAQQPVVRPEFFTNARYVWALVLVLIIYSTQLGYIVLLPFAVKDFHGLNQSEASMIMVPGYICAVLVGICSGKIGQVLTSRQTIFTALGMIELALIMGALAIQIHVAIVVASITLFASGFSLLYAPLVNTALANILPEKSGIAIGFYNLTINIGIPLGIAYTFHLMDLKLSYNLVLWILAAIGAAGTVIYFFADSWMKHAEHARGVVSMANQ